MTIGTRIWIGFSLSLLFTAALGYFSNDRIQRVSKMTRTVTGECLPGTALSGGFDGWARQEFALLTMQIMSGNPAEREELSRELGRMVARFQTDFERYETSIRQPEDREKFEQTRTAYRHWKELREKALALVTAEKAVEARGMMTELFQASKQVTDVTGAMMDWNAEYGSRIGGETSLVVEKAVFWIRTGTVAILVIGLGAAIWIGTSIRRALVSVAGRLDAGATQLAIAAQDVASTSQELAAGAGQQAASLEETGASLEEMTSMVRKTGDSAGRAGTLSSETREAANVGLKNVQQLNQAIAEVGKAGEEVAGIAKDIDAIAFQTNILALNAAVEAARAGEAGTGFAVVADEVRNLAQRSAAAARDATARIEVALTRSRQSATASAATARELETVVSRIGEVDGFVAQVATAVNEQSLGIQQINIAVSEIDRLTQANAAGAEQGAVAADGLRGQAASVRELAAELHRLVYGNSGRRSANAAPNPGGGRSSEASGGAAPSTGRNP
jgi:methyl-accepting chemotaxis protein